MSSSEEEMDNHDHVDQEQEINDNERTAIREELSTLTFEELQKLKERIGAKVYNEALFGSKMNKKEEESKINVFKRENKNRPREVTSKKPVSMLRDIGSTKKKKEIRDPRFDPLCGEFDKKQFSTDYNFLSDLRVKDIKAIKAELKETTDPQKEEKLRRLLQRLTEQHRVNKKRTVEKERVQKERAQVENEFKEGRKPHFKNKSESRVEALVRQYEELRSEGSGRVQRHLKRRQQKIKKRSHRPAANAPSS